VLLAVAAAAWLALGPQADGERARAAPSGAHEQPAAHPSPPGVLARPSRVAADVNAGRVSTALQREFLDERTVVLLAPETGEAGAPALLAALPADAHPDGIEVVQGMAEVWLPRPPAESTPVPFVLPAGVTAAEQPVPGEVIVRDGGASADAAPAAPVQLVLAPGAEDLGPAPGDDGVAVVRRHAAPAPAPARALLLSPGIADSRTVNDDNVVVLPQIVPRR